MSIIILKIFLNRNPFDKMRQVLAKTTCAEQLLKMWEIFYENYIEKLILTNLSRFFYVPFLQSSLVGWAPDRDWSRSWLPLKAEFPGNSTINIWLVISKLKTAIISTKYWFFMKIQGTTTWPQKLKIRLEIQEKLRFFFLNAL